MYSEYVFKKIIYTCITEAHLGPIKIFFLEFVITNFYNLL